MDRTSILAICCWKELADMEAKNVNPVLVMLVGHAYRHIAAVAGIEQLSDRTFLGSKRDLQYYINLDVHFV
jgi:hypothetical protein